MGLHLGSIFVDRGIQNEGKMVDKMVDKVDKRRWMVEKVEKNGVQRG